MNWNFLAVLRGVSQLNVYRIEDYNATTPLGKKDEYVVLALTSEELTQPGTSEIPVLCYTLLVNQSHCQIRKRKAGLFILVPALKHVKIRAYKLRLLKAIIHLCSL